MGYEFHLDFDGQRKAEEYSRCILIIFGTIGFIWGYYVQLFSHMVYILGVGFVLSSIVSLPAWPIYRRKPLNWQPHVPREIEGAN